MSRAAGPSVRLKLTLSYAGFLMVAGILLLSVVWVFLLRYVPDGAIDTSGGFVPNRSDLIDAFAPAAGAVLLFLLVLGLAGGWFLAGRMLAPLTQIRDAARRVGSGSLSHRVELAGPQDEFRELADVFDTMLDRLEAHVAEQQRFAANASHELRTPLAISQTLLDVAMSDPERDDDVLITKLHTVNARAIELTEALLLLSRADQRSFARDAVDLSLVVEEVVETLLSLAEKRGVAIDVTGQTVWAAGSPALLERMVTNLVQNAIVHNLLGGGTILIHTESAQSQTVLRIENSGAAVESALVPTLTEPFRRGADRVHDTDHAGVGLGLAIVQSIVRAHDGELSISARPGGGLIVIVRLPAGHHRSR